MSDPLGAFADRFGHRNMLVLGYGLGVVTAALTALAFAIHAGNLMLLVGIFFVAGIYVAVQEALESTVTAEIVSQDTLATSYGTLGTVNGAAKFVSSSAVGALDRRFSDLQLRHCRGADGGRYNRTSSCADGLRWTGSRERRAE